jgi:glycosyltransferase involved in cell wall biosynthesis
MMTNSQPRRILLYGDFLPTGFGRIVRHVAQHLSNLNQYHLMGACVQWDGILPLPPAPMPFHVCALNGRDQGQGAMGYAQVIAQVAGAMKPDVIISVQDFPYHEMLRAAPIDWSVTGHIAITPIDGVPIAHHWLDIASQFDGMMTISEFGVEALRQAGVRAMLCPPGVDTGEFTRLADGHRIELRQKMGIASNAFVVGVMAMNQGRKDFPSMIAAFAEAYRDIPEAILYLDCDATSPMGWDVINMLAKPCRLDASRIKFRADAIKAGVQLLNDRYNLLDLHMVIAHREGYGLPHGEAMATGCPSVAIDYCSGREIIGDNTRGWLVPALAPHAHNYGTWGGAVDKWPDLTKLIAALREAYEQPVERQVRGERGMHWARHERDWTRAGTAVQNMLEQVLAKRGTDMDARI